MKSNDGKILSVSQGERGLALDPLVRQILNSSKQMIFIKGPKSKLLWANDIFCGLYGMNAEQLQGLIDAPFNEPDYTQQYVKDDAYVFENRAVLIIPCEPVTRFDGVIRYFRTIKSPIFDEAGNVIMTIGFSEDITDTVLRNQADEVDKKNDLTSNVLTQALETARKANLSKSMFLANISHELRTPMHGILSFAKLGIERIDKKSKAEIKSFFEEIYDSGSRLMSLLNDLLDLSKLEAGKMTFEFVENDLVTTTKEVIREFRAFAEEKKITFNLETNPPALVTAFDRERVSQVIRNLISNAVKFSDPESQINIRLEDVEKVIAFEISNKGIPIPKEEYSTIFNKFTQSSVSRSGSGGTGLGLAICFEILQGHDGRIWTDRSPDGQTVFRFEFPKRDVGKIPSAA